MDIGDDLDQLARALGGSLNRWREDRGAVVFAPLGPVVAGLVDATLTVAAGADAPEPGAILVFVGEGVDAMSVAEHLDGVPDPPLPTACPVWLGEPAGQRAPVVLEVRVGAGDTRRFELQQLRPSRGVRTPAPAPGKRGEGRGNLARRGDWFRGGKRRR